MRALVVYYSETGNTAKVAQALFDKLKTKEKQIKEIDDVSSLDGVDLIFCGFPVIEHSVPIKMQKFLKNIPAGAKIALFSTHGSFTDGLKSSTAFENAMTLASAAKVLGTIGFRGKVRQTLLDELEKHPIHKSWVEEAFSAGNHPNQSDLEDAANFGNVILNKFKSGLF
ncbi:flavodoxin family protein [bacterium]|nr:flavodoxin family protein [bacterium]